MEAAFLKAAAGFPDGPLLGLDVGKKTIGVAISTPTRSLAVAVTTIKRSKFAMDAEALAKIAAARGAVGLVLGLPLNMDGTEGPAAQSVRTFARNLSGPLTLPVAFWDERGSTDAAIDALQGSSREKAKADGALDSLAAQIILQDALDRLAQARQRQGS